MTTSCIFCKIIQGQTPAAMVLEDENCVAFLDHRPLFVGHCLLVPRPHHETLPDMPPELVGPLFANARLLSAAVVEGLGAQGSFVAINNKVSQSVPHLHVHVIPRRKGDGLRGFFWPRVAYASEAAMEETRQRIRASVAARA